MATHGFSRCGANSTRLRQWQREERGRHNGDDIGLVWVWTFGRGDDRSAGHDPEHTAPGQAYGQRLRRYLSLHLVCVERIWRHYLGVSTPHKSLESVCA